MKIRSLLFVLISLMILAFPIAFAGAKGSEAYVSYFTDTYGINVTNTGGAPIIEVSIVVHGATITDVTGNVGWSYVQNTTDGGEDRVTWTADSGKDSIRTQRYNSFGFQLSNSPDSISWTAYTKKPATSSTEDPPYPTS